MRIGFARAGNRGVSVDTQWKRLQQEGCSQIFEEEDENNFSRKSKALESALNATNESDVLVVTRLDKLACSIGDLAAIIKRLQGKGAQLKVIDQRIDTTESDLAFNIIASLAEFENDVKAHAREAKSGRKPILSKKDEQEIIRLYREENLPVDQLTVRYNVSHRTIYRTIKKGLDTASESGGCHAAYPPQEVGHNQPRRIYSSYA
jgi:DNA invertase Pin-like site-specific DNA recombinase